MKPSCLILHGLGGGPYELEPLIAGLENQGFRVAAPVFPGHEVDGRVMPASHWWEWIDTAQSAFDELAAEGRPVVVVGFSTGGTVALELSTRRPVDRLVLLAPFMAIRHSHRLPFEMASVLRPIARFVPNVPRWGSPFRDRSARRALAKADRFHTFSIHATLSALELIEIVKPKLATITIPTLIIQGKLDAVIEPRAVSWLHEQLGSIDKTLVILPRSDHLIALDRERDQVLELTTNFLLRSEKMVGSTGDR